MSRSSAGAGRVVRSGGVIIGAPSPAGADPSPSPRRQQANSLSSNSEGASAAQAGGIGSAEQAAAATTTSSASFVRSGSVSPLPVTVDIPTVGSLDIFSCFHKKKDELSAVVMAPEETVVTNPISDEILAKLKKRQNLLTRSFTGASPLSGGSNNSNSFSTTVAAAGGAAGKVQTPTSSNDPAARRSGGVWTAPRPPSITPSTSQGSKDGDDDGDDDDVRSDESSIIEDALGRRGENDGFGVGENFFSFAPRETKPQHQRSLTMESLQATVVVPSTTVTTFTGAQRQQQQQQQQRRPIAQQQEEVKRIVPLWSVERMNLLGGYCSDNARVALHQEIMDLVEYLKPCQAEVSMRRFIELQVADLARSLFPGCEPVVYGSMTTHLVLPLSDLDMSILNVQIPVDDALNQLARAIANAGLCVAAYPQVILKTKVPLLKFTHKGSLLDVDVSINAGDGKNNSEIVRQLLKKYPEARYLTIVIKYFLQQRDMHEPYKGGLGSYATVILVISFLQHHPIYTTHIADRCKTGLGKLLVDFFRYYGNCFNYNRCGVSLDNGGFYFIRKTQGGTGADSFGRGGPPQLVVEDPGNPDNNATSSLRIFPSIASTFDHAYIALTGEFELAGKLEDMTPDSPLVSMRPTLLSRILHVDAESVARRQAIINCYQQLLADNMEHFHHVVHSHRADEDAAMIRLHSSLAAHVERRQQQTAVGSSSQAGDDGEGGGGRAGGGRKHHRRDSGRVASSPELEGGGGSSKRRRREGR